MSEDVINDTTSNTATVVTPVIALCRYLALLILRQQQQ